MKKEFRGWYRLSDGEFKGLWDNCYFTFDANVLLGLYRYSDKTRKVLLDILRNIKRRAWIPHQAALEYHKNRLNTITGLNKVCDEITDKLTKVQNSLTETLAGCKWRHPSIEPDDLIKIISGAFATVEKQIKVSEKEIPDRREDDEIRDAITKLFDNKVGPPYPLKKLDEIYEEGKQRFKHKVPPGYMDEDPQKKFPEQYGDLVMWYQIIDKAKADRRPIIFVTEEKKEDWWQLHRGKIVAPHPKLVEEIKSMANVDFYMYRAPQFIERAGEYLGLKITKEAANEIKDLAEEEKRGEPSVWTTWYPPYTSPYPVWITNTSRGTHNIITMPSAGYLPSTPLPGFSPGSTYNTSSNTTTCNICGAQFVPTFGPANVECPFCRTQVD